MEITLYMFAAFSIQGQELC